MPDQNTQRLDTICHVLSEEQIRSVRDHLDGCAKAGARSVLLMTSNREGFGEAIKILQRTGEISQMPEPDVVTVTTMYVIGLTATQDRVAQMLQEQQEDR